MQNTGFPGICLENWVNLLGGIAAQFHNERSAYLIKQPAIALLH